MMFQDLRPLFAKRNGRPSLARIAAAHGSTPADDWPWSGDPVGIPIEIAMEIQSGWWF